MSVLRVLPAAVLGLCLVSSTEAAVVVRVDLDRNTAGIQSNIAAIAGQEIQGAIILEVVGDLLNEAIRGYDIALRFRTDELNLNPTFNFLDTDSMGNVVLLTQPGNPTPPPLIGGGNMSSLTSPINRGFLEDEGVVFDFTDDNNGPASPGLAGIFRDIDSGAIEGIATGGGTIASIYQFNLTAVNPTGGVSSLDVVPVIIEEAAFLDLQLNPLPRNQITLIGASVTAVPEPSTLAFLGMGTLIAVRRYRKRQSRVTASV